MKSIFLNIFSITTLLAGIFSITSKNPVVSVLFLISTFVFAACYLIVNGINFIALSYIIVYVGAIAILFLFVVMMINIKISDTLETGNQYTKILPLGITIVTFFIWVFYSIIPLIFNQKLFIFLSNYSLLEVVYQITNFNKEIILYQADILSNNFQQIDSIGFSLYVYGAIPLIVCSLILLLAMFSAIIIPPTSLSEENIKTKEFDL